MDPNRTWQELVDAVRNDDWVPAADLAEVLLDWLNRDGFPPNITGIREFDRVAARAVCDAVAAWEIA